MANEQVNPCEVVRSNNQDFSSRQLDIIRNNYIVTGGILLRN